MAVMRGQKLTLGQLKKQVAILQKREAVVHGKLLAALRKVERLRGSSVVTTSKKRVPMEVLRRKKHSSG